MNKLTNYFLVKQFLLFSDTPILNIQTGGKNNKKRWDTLIHNGPMFPIEYTPHHIPILYKNQKIELSPDAEEFATIYAKYIDTDYIKNKKFNKNFWNDWKKLLKGTIITNLEDCDFSLIHKYILEQKEKNTFISKEEKEKIKEEQLKIEEPVQPQERIYRNYFCE